MVSPRDLGRTARHGGRHVRRARRIRSWSWDSFSNLAQRSGTRSDDAFSGPVLGWE